jgi:hypothetical protein
MATPHPTNEAFINEAYDSRFTRVKKEASYSRRGPERKNVSFRQNSQVRKVRTATMYEEPKKDSSYKTELQDTASIFNDTYAERGIQPTYKTNLEKETTQKKDRTAVATSQNIRRVTKRSSMIGAVAKKVPLVRVASIAAKGIGRKKVKVINRILLPAGMALWTIQFPLALFAIGAFGITASIEVAKASIVESTGKVGEAIFEIAGGVFSSVASAIQAVTGFDPSVIGDAPQYFFMITTSFAFLIGLITLLLIGIVYAIAGINPFLGRGSSLKIGTFVFAIMGYMLPFFNMVPWFGFWTWAVGRYPD